MLASVRYKKASITDNRISFTPTNSPKKEKKKNNSNYKKNSGTRNLRHSKTLAKFSQDLNEISNTILEYEDKDYDCLNYSDSELIDSIDMKKTNPMLKNRFKNIFQTNNIKIGNIILKNNYNCNRTLIKYAREKSKSIGKSLEKPYENNIKTQVFNENKLKKFLNISSYKDLKFFQYSDKRIYNKMKINKNYSENSLREKEKVKKMKETYLINFKITLKKKKQNKSLSNL